MITYLYFIAISTAPINMSEYFHFVDVNQCRQVVGGRGLVFPYKDRGRGWGGGGWLVDQAA